MCVEEGTNEILIMELIHQYVEILDSYFGNVCELDLIFNFDKVCAKLISEKTAIFLPKFVKNS